MGEVYTAKDTKIKRNVAVKVLSPSFSANPERLRRFEQEAQAAGALNHPNVMVVYDVGTHDGAPYVVSELLEGETLRKRLNTRPLPLLKAVTFALEIAQGLSAAHEKGIIHRDLKPENIFITKDEHVKILDFGLAKLKSVSFNGEAQTDAPTVAPDTNAGVIVGTAGYMSPEQVRAETRNLDHRSDIFSFGAVFYEMLTRRRAFQGRSAVETMNSILHDDPLDSPPGSPTFDPVVERLLRHCLEKDPHNRFQSTRDLTFDLETARELLGSGANFTARRRPTPRRQGLRVATAAALVVALALSTYFIGRGVRDERIPSYSQLTFRRGTVWSARFSPDEHTVVYSAAFDGGALDVFSTRRGSPESRPLGLPDCTVLSVSSGGEMLLLRHRQYLSHFSSRGTLARMPLDGTAPRPLFNDIQEADWSPDGSNLAIVRHVGGRSRLEYPVNKVLYETEGWVSNVRVSPRGDIVAFLDHPVLGDDRGRVAVIGAQRSKQLLSEEWSSVDSLAWTPNAAEVWFTAKRAGEAAALHAATLSGKGRVVLRVPAHLKLHDISRSGRILLSRGYDRADFLGLRAGETTERNLSWLDRTRVRDISPDGQTFLFSYWGEGSGTNYMTYLRKMEGTPAIPLGEGAAWALSPDGKHALSILAMPSQIVILPTDAGETRRLEAFGIEQYGLGANWLPDGNSILFIGRESGKGMRVYVQSISGGPPRPVTPEGITGTVISPDGEHVIVADPDQNKFILSLKSEKLRPLEGFGKEERAIRWSDVPQTIYVYNPKEMPVKVYRYNMETGTKKLWKEVTPNDRTGILGEIHLLITPDGSSYIYDFRRFLSDLYLVEGL